jgi:hypothetical protein
MYFDLLSTLFGSCFPRCCILSLKSAIICYTEKAFALVIALGKGGFGWEPLLNEGVIM